MASSGSRSRVQDHDAVLQALSDGISPRVLEAPGRLDDVARELDEYFAGRRTTFDVPLDLRLLHGFRRAVVEHLPDIAYGRTASYAEMATLVPAARRAVRAVGTACALNPLPLVLPCHRVVRSDGSPGQYAGGADAKRALLALETRGRRRVASVPCAGTSPRSAASSRPPPRRRSPPPRASTCAR